MSTSPGVHRQVPPTLSGLALQPCSLKMERGKFHINKRKKDEWNRLPSEAIVSFSEYTQKPSEQSREYPENPASVGRLG